MARRAASRAASTDRQGRSCTILGPGIPSIRTAHPHAPPSAIGVMPAMAGIGSIVGSFIAGPIQQRLTLRRIMQAMLCIQGLLWPVLAIAPNAVSLGLTAAGLDGALTIYLVAQASLRLQLVPDELQGRVNGVCRLLVYGAMPLGSVVTGTLLESVGARGTVFSPTLLPRLRNAHRVRK